MFANLVSFAMKLSVQKRKLVRQREQFAVWRKLCVERSPLVCRGCDLYLFIQKCERNPFISPRCFWWCVRRWAIFICILFPLFVQHFGLQFGIFAVRFVCSLCHCQYLPFQKIKINLDSSVRQFMFEHLMNRVLGCNVFFLLWWRLAHGVDSLMHFICFNYERFSFIFSVLRMWPLWQPHFNEYIHR